MSSLRVLIVGSGGREHALAWRLAPDPECGALWVAPGNPGIARHFECLPIAAEDSEGLLAAARAERMDLVVVGPEGPLALGVADRLRAAGVAVFGPSAAAARVESSKWFAKRLMLDLGIPTAAAEGCEDLAAVRRALDQFGAPHVIKVDGLAAGKGVCVTSDRMAAEAFAREALESGRFGAGGRLVVVEEALEGEEASVIAVTDGEDFVLLPAARDYKRALDQDLGTNTGGMGAFAPTAAVSADDERVVAERVVRPLLTGLRNAGTPFQGALYVGLMMGSAGPRVLEFNARFGDPESQVVLPLLEGSLLALLQGAARGRMDARAVSRAAGAAVTVALVDADYPIGARGDGVITGLDALERDPLLHVFHAGSEWEGDVARVRGGRAAYVTAVSADHESARARVYRAIARLGGSGWRCRSDIASARSKHVVDATPTAVAT